MCSPVSEVETTRIFLIQGEACTENCPGRDQQLETPSAVWKGPVPCARRLPKGRQRPQPVLDDPVARWRRTLPCPVHHRHPGGRMLPAQGAVPIYKHGELVRGIGGSGATAQQDECAQAGGAVL